MRHRRRGIEASRSLDLKVPLVVRLEDTQGEKLLQVSGLAFTKAEDMDAAATKAVAAIVRGDEGGLGVCRCWI